MDRTNSSHAHDYPAQQVTVHTSFRGPPLQYSNSRKTQASPNTQVGEGVHGNLLFVQ